MTAFSFSSFRPDGRLAIVVFLALIVLLGLGTWQLQRLQWKTDLIASIDEAAARDPIKLGDRSVDFSAINFRPVSVQGQFLNDAAFGFGAYARNGVLGARLVVPLRMTDGRSVLVERGWMPSELLPPNVPSGLEPTDVVEIVGAARDRSDDAPSWFTPENEPDRRQFYWYDFDEIEDLVGLDLLPLVITAKVETDSATLPRAVPTQPELSNNHLSYAVTWFGLAATLIGVFVAFSIKRQG